MVEALFKPIPIAYRGLYADDHLVDAQQFGSSVASIAQIANSICHEFFFENVTHDPRSYQIRFYVGTSKKNGLVQDLVPLIGAGLLPVFAPILIKTGKIFIEKTFDAVIQKILNRPTDLGNAVDKLHELASKHAEFASQVHKGQMRDKKALLKIVERLAVENRAPLRHAPAPVGKSVRLLQIGDKREGAIIDEPAAEVLRSHDLMEIGATEQYDIKIVGVFKTNGTCRVCLVSDDKVVPGKIIDPALERTQNVYTTALNEDLPLRVTAKPTFKDGKLHKLFISDAVLHSKPARKR